MPEKNLEKLLSSINPKLHDAEFVFCTVTEEQLTVLKVAPRCVFREDEAVTLILEKSDAEQNSLAYDGVWSQK